ncbi:enolase C-terminal domain-like protein [Streptomyces sp. NPDC032940]|uniref:enolase C-terminal domain-like protein n=1 Tax=Streptomyces sp. NPDC032940 TaxID=3155366 RepID=UPI0033CC60AD
MPAAGAADCRQADMTRCGRITVRPRAAALARAHGVDISGHCAPHPQAHAAAAIPDVRRLEWFHDHVRTERLLLDRWLLPDGGNITPGADGVPGPGPTLDHERAQAYRAA